MYPQSGQVSEPLIAATTKTCSQGTRGDMATACASRRGRRIQRECAIRGSSGTPASRWAGYPERAPNLGRDGDGALGVSAEQA